MLNIEIIIYCCKLVCTFQINGFKMNVLSLLRGYLISLYWPFEFGLINDFFARFLNLFD